MGPRAHPRPGHAVRETWHIAMPACSFAIAHMCATTAQQRIDASTAVGCPEGVPTSANSAARWWSPLQLAWTHRLRLSTQDSHTTFPWRDVCATVRTPDEHPNCAHRATADTHRLLDHTRSMAKHVCGGAYSANAKTSANGSTGRW
jgi:hypothetical protein